MSIYQSGRCVFLPWITFSWSLLSQTCPLEWVILAIYAHFHLRKAFSIFSTYWHTCGENSQLPPIFLTVSPDKPLLHNLAKPYFVKPDPRNFPFPTNHQFYPEPLFTTRPIFNQTLAMLLAIYLLGAKDDCLVETVLWLWGGGTPNLAGRYGTEHQPGIFEKKSSYSSYFCASETQSYQIWQIFLNFGRDRWIMANLLLTFFEHFPLIWHY